ncbi:hypothetical protein COLO4_31042 [Corchorus olitorius]|uniref:DUF4408 domain-containing protein n=1 Tax=Corchorus olitorius TaxID=93759 RepID=A0A1R3H673_9ROSI|nr:hypothetical protein COLO4_31042 [Corchorus olitorius]
MSFFAFLFSIAFYISIFYIFSLSPSSLLSNTKFWFVISNTLILIIAADYGAFYSSKEKFDLHEEYALHSQARSVVASSFVSQYPEPEVVKKSNIIPKEEEVIMISPKDHETKEDDQKNEIAPDEKIVEVVKFEPVFENHEHPINKAYNKISSKNIIEPKTIRRSKSDRVTSVTFHDDKKHILRRSGTEKHETINAEDQENEFSTMSDEELNRRVEEFIQNFNRQIRLQGARSRQLLYREE